MRYQLLQTSQSSNCKSPIDEVQPVEPCALVQGCPDRIPLNCIHGKISSLLAAVCLRYNPEISAILLEHKQMTEARIGLVKARAKDP